MSQENKAIARRVVDEGFGKGNLGAIDELIAPTFVNHDPAQPADLPSGPEGVKQSITMYRAAFPDLRINVEDQIAEGDRVVTRWSASGTQQGDLMGVPATGREARATGITIDRIEGGKITESWTNWDTLGLLQQLGAIPETAPTQP